MIIIKYNRFTIYGICFVWICILIILLLNLDQNYEKVTNLFHNEENGYFKFTLYDLNATQNMSTYSYKINVASIEGEPLKDDNLKLAMRMFGTKITEESLFIVDYASTKNITFEKNYIEGFEVPENSTSTNFSISITYFNSNNDDKLSVNDFFMVEIKNKDNGQYYDLQNFRFEIVSTNSGIIGRLKIGEEFPHDQGSTDEIE